MQHDEESPVSLTFNVVMGLIMGLLVIFVLSCLVLAIACVWFTIAWII